MSTSGLPKRKQSAVKIPAVCWAVSSRAERSSKRSVHCVRCARRLAICRGNSRMTGSPSAPKVFRHSSTCAIGSPSSQTNSTPRFLQVVHVDPGTDARPAMHDDMRPVRRIDRDIVGGEFGSGDIVRAVSRSFRATDGSSVRRPPGPGKSLAFGRSRKCGSASQVPIQIAGASKNRKITPAVKNDIRRRSVTGPNHSSAASGSSDHSG